MYKRKFQKIFLQTKFILILLLSIAVIFGCFKLEQFAVFQKMTPGFIWQLINGKNNTLKQISDRTNILLLGIGGKDHDGSDLTDTTILVSVDLVKQDAVLISIPRDIWVNSFKDKINAAYQIGEKKQSGGGFVVTKAAVEEVTGIPVHYAVLIDFSGFKEIIDLIKGIDVQIEETFTDNEYPIAGRENDVCGGDPEFKCRYESVTFNTGMEHMDGERALKYVRSRHAEGDSGTDFSRSARQQVVIAAIKNKLVNKKIVFNPSKMIQLWKIFQKTTKTDLVTGEIILLGRKVAFEKPVIRSYTLSWDRPEKNQPGLLINPPQWQYNNLWVLVPKDGSYRKIHEYIKCLIENNQDCELIYK